MERGELVRQTDTHKRRNEMTPLKLTEGLTDELLEVIRRYDESMPLVSVLGVLDVVKMQLLWSHFEDDDYDD